MKNKIRTICDLMIGLLCVCATIIGYYKDISYMGEYCFISGMLVGIFFIFSFGYRVKRKKELPVWLYFDCMITLLIILIATLAIGLNLEGAFWFIHIINPIIVFLYWCFFCNQQEITRGLLVATDIIFPLCYLVFAFIWWKVMGICPFPASMLFEMQNVWSVLAGIIVLAIAFLLLGYALHFLKRLIHKRTKSGLLLDEQNPM